MKIKTKTKINLKRALLFFIPLCLIAGMLAVPAFAATSWVTNLYFPALSDTEIAPETLILNNGTAEVCTEGMYAVTTTAVSPDGDGADAYNESNPLVPMRNSGAGYIKCIDKTGVYSYEINTADGHYASYYVSNSGTVFYEFWSYYPSSDSYVKETVNSGEVISLTFYFFNYPPDFDVNDNNYQTQWIWLYVFTTGISASRVVDSSSDPDPEPPAGGDDDGEGDTSGIFAVWTQITDWMIDGLKSATNAFYYNGQLTLLGYLCIIPLALGVALLLISIIQKFLRLRG